MTYPLNDRDRKRLLDLVQEGIPRDTALAAVGISTAFDQMVVEGDEDLMRDLNRAAAEYAIQAHRKTREAPR